MFYHPDLQQTSFILEEETSKHLIQVLRRQKGDEMQLTDGKGTIATAIIEDDHRKRCAVRVLQQQHTPPPTVKNTIAISLVKNASRFEWFLEKATELGIAAIIPLLCDRTETEKFRSDRMQGILLSAMLQSQQTWLPELTEPMDLYGALQRSSAQKFIAHCLPEGKTELSEAKLHPSGSLILIGPEGDFTPREIQAALATGCEPVSLGATRLRTETAGIAAATWLQLARRL